MDAIQSIHGVTPANIKERADEVIAEFDRNGVVVLRGEKMTPEESLYVLSVLGDIAGWLPNTSISLSWKYTENHERVIVPNKNRNTNHNDTRVVPWHLEHPEYRLPQVAAAWNMHTFTCSSESGQTGFIDASMLFEMLPDDWKTFARKCLGAAVPLDHRDSRSMFDLYGADVADRVAAGERVIWPATDHMPLAIHHVVSKHPRLGKETLRLCPSEPLRLVLVDGKKPTDEEFALYQKICDWVCSKQDEAEVQRWWQWQEGDVLIPDLFLMIHGVKGGFEVGERIFTGNWAYPDTPSLREVSQAGYDYNRETGDGRQLGYWSIEDEVLVEAACCRQHDDVVW